MDEKNWQEYETWSDWVDAMEAKEDMYPQPKDFLDKKVIISCIMYPMSKSSKIQTA